MACFRVFLSILFWEPASHLCSLCEQHMKVSLLTYIRYIYYPFCLLHIKPIPKSCQVCGGIVEAAILFNHYQRVVFNEYYSSAFTFHNQTFVSQFLQNRWNVGVVKALSLARFYNLAFVYQIKLHSADLTYFFPSSSDKKNNTRLQSNYRLPSPLLKIRIIVKSFLGCLVEALEQISNSLVPNILPIWELLKQKLYQHPKLCTPVSHMVTSKNFNICELKHVS
ncbi:Os01g0158533 [Oryza sativa Japonica Group]|uniref:Os01g0158533 protein n=1 Tax=Oryza sativa subsp. japonica TaxID=39947 RepID=A0A0P0UYA0_ORYSJ|nr:Os01g0158533 [Oryza sativa Japonica Group]